MDGRGRPQAHPHEITAAAMQLTVIEHAGQPVDVDRRTAVVFRPPGGTIGRDVDNHLVLRDETRHISRLQALLQVGETSCSLKNLSSVSTIEINQRRIGYAQVEHVRAGDTIRIGSYLLRAETDEGEPAAAQLPPAPHAIDAGATADGAISNRDRTPPAAPQAVPPDVSDLHSLPTDPLQLFTSPHALAVEGLIGFGGNDGRARSAESLSPALPPQPGPRADNAPVTSSDRAREWASPFRLQPASEAPAGQLRPNGTPVEDPGDTATKPAASAPSFSESEPVTAEVLLRAFFEGAGLDATAMESRWSAQQLFVAGQLLSLFANGTVELLSARSILKREVRADMTMLLDRENNPLKLLPDGGSALRQMFGLPFPGFMSPQSAVSDAFQDLHAHQIGMVAGMRAALTDLIAKFAPERLLARNAEPRWYERKWPMLHRARMWERYVALHRDVVLSVEDDFASVFGKSFLDAYDSEIERYRGQRRPG